jgi:beta-fructofuranosidase
VGRIQDARIYAKPLDAATIAALVPGQAGAGLKPWAWWSFADEGLRERTGRFNQLHLVGDVRMEKGCLVLSGKGATVVAASAPEAGTGSVAWAPVPKSWSRNTPVPAEVVRSTRLLRERFLADPYRPGYHFCVPEDMGMPGDPNGAFYHGGRYHLMYLYNRNGTGFCWGHISSKDLVHWRHHPDAIGPGGSDEGCFSGGAFVDDDGTAYLSYWMLWGAKGIGLARSRGPSFDTWTKLEANPVIRSTEFGITEAKGPDGKPFLYGSADPSNIWKKDGRYYILTGNLLVLNKIGRVPDAPLDQQGDRLYLLASDDLKTWKYLHVFYERNPQWTDRSEDNMCPSFLPLPSGPEGGPPSKKHLLLFIAHNRGCQYYVGDYRNDRFYPENHGRMSWVDNTYFAPEALVDGQGRQIMWAWLTDNPPAEERNGWSGVYGLPRSLWLGDDGTLRMRPVKELESLRCHEKTWKAMSVAAGKPQRLEGVTGDSCEVEMTIEPAAAKRVGLKVRAAADGKEETLLYYDAERKELVFDAARSGATGRTIVERAPLALAKGEALHLRVFVDKSIVEVYANDRQSIGRRVYPTQSDSQGIALFAEGGEATFQQVRAWEMAPSNPY